MCGIARDNSTRRQDVWDRRSLPYRVITFIPFHIYDWVLAELEFSFAAQCQWCGRQYFRNSRAKECCSGLKKERGEYPGLWGFGIGGYGSGHLAEYNPNSDTYYDRSTGKTYHSNNY